MTGQFVGNHRAIAVTIALIGIAACSKDSTSPTPIATSVAVTAGIAQNGVVGVTLAGPIAVQVTDQSGKPLSGVTVTFTPTATSGKVTTADGAAASAEVTTDANGAAQILWTLGTVAGADSLTVTVASLASVTVKANATPDAPAAITVVAGDGQSAPAGSALGTSLAVKVVDQYGNAVPNVAVQWSDTGGGTLSTTTTVTDANGIAQDGFTLGPSAGPEAVKATIVVGGSPVAASFTELGT